MRPPSFFLHLRSQRTYTMIHTFAVFFPTAKLMGTKREPRRTFRVVDAPFTLPLLLFPFLFFFCFHCAMEKKCKACGGPTNVINGRT